MARKLNVGTLVGKIKLDPSGMAAGLAQAEQKLQRFGATGATTAAASGKKIGGAAGAAVGTSFGSKMSDGFKNVAKYSGIATGLAGIASAVKGTLSLGIRFQDQINTLGAVSGATAGQLKKVSEKAKDLGSDIQIPGTSAADAAMAMTELAKGGLSVSQAMTAAKGTLQLAAAAQVSGAQAAEIQANALNTFGLKASDAGRVADVLANTANAASGEITDFARGMQQAGSVAKLFGIPIEDASTALGIFANNGIKGSDAGTSLKSMLTMLATPSKQAQAALDKLNVTVYNSQGKFVGLRSLTKQLARAQDNMTDAAFQSAAGIAFGSDAIRAASTLASGGVSAFDQMKDAITRSGGAADLAEAKMKGLGGALQKAQNSLQDVALSVYQKVEPAAEALVKGFTGVVNFFQSSVGPAIGVVFDGLGGIVKVGGDLLGLLGDLPGPIKAFGVALGGLALASKVGLLGKLSSALLSVKSAVSGMRGAWSRLGDDAALGGVSKMRAGIGLLGSTARRTGGKLLGMVGGPYGLALATATTAVVTWWQSYKDAKKPIADVNKLIDENTGKLKDNAAQTVANALKDYIVVARHAGIAQGELVAAVLEGGPALDKVTKKLNDWNGVVAEGADKGKAFVDDQKKARELAEKLGVQYDATAKAQQKATRAAAEAKAAQQKMNGATKDGATAQGRYVASLKARHSAEVAAQKAARESGTAYTNARKALNYLNRATGEYTGRISLTAKDLAHARKAAQGAGDSWQRMGKQIVVAKDNLDDGRTATERMSDSLGLFAKQTDSADTKLKFFAMTIDKVTGRKVRWQDALQAYNDAVRGMAEQWKNAKKEVDGGANALINANGVVDTSTQVGSDLYDQLKQMRDGYDQVVDGAEQLARKQGSTNEAMATARAKADDARDSFIHMATTIGGLTLPKAKALADQMGILAGKDIPNKAFEIDATDKATPKINGINWLLEHELHDRTINVDVQTNYTSARQALNYPGAAEGGAVRGPGTKGVDSEPRMLAPGEHVLTDKDVDAMGGQAAVYTFRRMLHAGTGMAAGGALGSYSTPTLRSLSGRGAPNLGPVVSVMVEALGGLRAAIAATGSSAKDAAGNLRDARKAYRQQQAEERKTAREQRRNVAQARSQGRRDIADARSGYRDTNRRTRQQVNDARQAYRRTVAQAERDRREARAKVNSLKPGKERQEAWKRLGEVIRRNGQERADAKKRLRRAEQDRRRSLAEAQRDINKARRDSRKSIRQAVAAQRKANRAEDRKTAATHRAVKAAERATAAERRRAVATRANIRAMQGATSAQRHLGRELQVTNNRIDDAKSKLADLRKSRQQLANSIAGGITGGTSITDSSGKSISGIIGDLRHDLFQTRKFRGNLASLAKHGLNADTLQSIAAGGLQSAPLAAKLAGASHGAINEINRLHKAIEQAANRSGNVVGKAMYGSQISAEQGALRDLRRDRSQLQHLANVNARQMQRAVRAGLNGVTFKLALDGKVIDARVEEIMHRESDEIVTG